MCPRQVNLAGVQIARWGHSAIAAAQAADASVRTVNNRRLSKLLFGLLQCLGANSVNTETPARYHLIIRQKRAGMTTPAPGPLENLPAEVLDRKLNPNTGRWRHDRILPCCKRVVLLPEQVPG
jgi:hypothetical protein